MSSSSIDKPAKKHKKAKDPPLEVEGQEGEGERPRRTKKGKKVDETTASTPADANVIESPAGHAKQKSHRKRKNAGGENVLEGSQDASSEPKKKKKHRHEEATEHGDDLQTEGDDSRRKKRKERKETAAEGVQHEHEHEGRDGDEGAGDHSIEVQPSPAKKDKREKKKRKRLEDEGGNPRSKEKSKKKRKRRSSSGFLNPCEDESLSEQARKALEYAFAQFEDPDSWKFHEARQNWILRNIWSDEAIPEGYMPLAMRYLQGVQGGARETLIRSCREAMESLGPPATSLDTGENEEIPSQTSEAEDPTKKRTVRFTVDEQDNRNIPSSTNETKRQRAASLLTALTA